MGTFHIDCQLQADRNRALVGGEIDADDARIAWARVEQLLLIKGLWVCKMRNGRRWLKTRKYRRVADGLLERVE